MFSIYLAVVSGSLFFYSNVVGVCTDYGNNQQANIYHLTITTPNPVITTQQMTCVSVPQTIVTVPATWTETDIGLPIISK